MTHVMLHKYYWAVCAANGCPPADWGEARLLSRVLAALGRLPAPEEVFDGEPDPEGAAEGWLEAFRGGGA